MTCQITPNRTAFILSLTHPKDFLIDRILYRDGLILVINKPAGLAVHGQPGNHHQTHDHLERYFDAIRFGLPRLPALAHRLDRDTSGCLVLSRHPKAARKVGKLFQEGRVRKTYWALCKGTPEKRSGTIDFPLIKKNSPKGWSIEVAVPATGSEDTDDEKAQQAITVWRTLKREGDLNWIECRPKTGRTHQLRVHLAAIGLPIIGDSKYGVALDQTPMMLHAQHLSVPLSSNKPPIDVTAPPPTIMAEMLETLP